MEKLPAMNTFKFVVIKIGFESPKNIRTPREVAHATIVKDFN